jgi:WD40 repeat protein/class 3 adenylate cyclase/tRNA A-37 threonylcarbamoyl transferase component Bud32
MDTDLPNESVVLAGRHRTDVVALVFTDIVGSTSLKHQLGDRAGVSLIQRHHAVVRECLAGFPAGKEVETAGDSFLIAFSTPSAAVEFALLLQARVREFSKGSAAELQDRIGIHVGEVVVQEHARGLKPRDLYGIQVDVCARVMSLAEGGQILLTRPVFDSARQMLKGGAIAGVGQLSWLNHGSYEIKGLQEPIEICEVGEVGQGPLTAPVTSEKAHRRAAPGAEPVLGWRPAVEQVVPHTQWVLEKKLGEGGFGEVWLGRHQKLKEERVFKFCFRADRVRSLKRETTLFRVLKERVGDHPNIVRLLEVYFEEPPFYVVMDHVEGQDLKSWCEQRGGVDKVPLEVRLEIVAQIADALQAAHDAGVIHRDVKPGNILVCNWREPQSPSEASRTSAMPIRAKLTDFGIGQVVSEEALEGITREGFTQTIVRDSSSSQTGTQMYMAPELMAGKPASIRSDIYSLGVVLYQLVVGDLSRPVATDWAEEISDGLLTEDLKRCFAGHPEQRFAGAGQLAEHLRALPERRAAVQRKEAERQRQQAEKAALERAAYRRGMMRTAGFAAIIVALVAGLAIVALQQSRKAEETARGEREQRQRAETQEAKANSLLYLTDINLAQQAWEENQVGRLEQLLDDTQDSSYRGFEWYYWQRQLHLFLQTFRGHFDSVLSVAFSPDGQRIATGSGDGMAKVWEAASGKELLTLKGHRGYVWSVAFSPDGQRIVTGSEDATAKVWESASGRELITLTGSSDPIWSVAFSPDGKRVVAGSKDGTAKVWEAATGRRLLTPQGHTIQVAAAALSPDGRRIVTGSTEADGDYTAKVWEAASGKELLTLNGHRGQVASVAFSPNGQRIVTGSQDNTAKVWDAASGSELLTFKGHGNAVWSVAVSPDGQRIVTGSGDQTAKVWEAASGKELLTLKGHRDSVRSVAFSPDGQRIVTGSRDMTARVWEAVSGNEPLTLKGHVDGVWAVAVSPDCQRIVTGSRDNTAKVWEAANGKELFTLEGHSNAVWSVAFSPDGHCIVTGSHDNTAKMWEAATGRELRALKGHTGPVRSVASPRTDSVLPPAVMIIRPRSGRRRLAVNSARSRGTAPPLDLSPFPRTASVLSRPVWIRRPKCGRRRLAGNYLRLRGIPG